MTTLEGKNELVATKISGSAPVPCDAVQAQKQLLVYDIAVQGTISGANPLYFASFSDPSIAEQLSSTATYVAMRKARKDAFKILKLLSTFVHPNLLVPGGDWEMHIPGDCAGDPELLITFQEVHGLLSDLPKTELFILSELPNAQKQSTNIMHLQGFSQNGLKAWSHLLGVVEHVNENYAALPDKTLPQPLRLDADSIFYQEIPDGKYHVLLGDFYTRIEHYTDLGLPKRPTLQEIKQANWKGLGKYLKIIVGENYVPSPEINQLISVLETSTTTVDDIMWEPALWDANIKMSFFREIVMCIEADTTGTRKRTLANKPKLGLQDCIRKLGVAFEEKDLLGSVKFLRNKIAAHYDELYSNYSGSKKEIGSDKATIEKFLLKEQPNYMIKLIKEIRPLGWITKSPLARHADYKHLVKTTANT